MNHTWAHKSLLETNKQQQQNMKRKILESARKEKRNFLQGRTSKMTADFSTETMFA